MTIEAKELLQKIQQTNEDVDFLKNKIVEIGQEKLNQVIQYAIKGLKFEAIHMVAAYNDELSEEDGESFTNEQGVVLKGVKVLESIEDGDIEEDFGWEVHKEIFLLNDGSLKTFDTIYRLRYCLDCGVTHSNLERKEAEVDLECEHRTETIINNIFIALKSTYELAMQRKSTLSDSLDKLQAIKIS